MPMTRGAIILVESNYENLQLHYPRLRLMEAGYEVKIVGPEQGATYTSKEGNPVVAELEFKDVVPKAVKILFVPGGYAPDRLRRYPACSTLVSAVAKTGAIMGFICHGGSVAISAKIVKGKRVTSINAIRDDLENAGATWVDEPCVVDGHMVTAQLQKDLPAMMKAILRLAGEPHTDQ
jgi:protease I